MHYQVTSHRADRGYLPHAVRGQQPSTHLSQCTRRGAKNSCRTAPHRVTAVPSTRSVCAGHPTQPQKVCNPGAATAHCSCSLGHSSPTQHLSRTVLGAPTTSEMRVASPSISPYPHLTHVARDKRLPSNTLRQAEGCLPILPVLPQQPHGIAVGYPHLPCRNWAHAACPDKRTGISKCHRHRQIFRLSMQSPLQAELCLAPVGTHCQKPGQSDPWFQTHSHTCCKTKPCVSESPQLLHHAGDRGPEVKLLSLLSDKTLKLFCDLGQATLWGSLVGT